MEEKTFNAIKIQEIMKLLPHRYPFLLIDRVTELIPGEKITAYKNVTFNEHFFQGHFPSAPVMPGVLIIVVPGDRLVLECSNLQHKMQLWKMDAKAYVDGQLVAQATLTASSAKADEIN